MKKRLQRILSILCVLMLVTGCLMLAASADEPNTIKVITARWDDEDDYEGLRPKGDIIMSINGTDVHLNAGNEWTGSAEAPADAKWTFATVEGYDSPVESGTSDVKVVTYRHNVPTTSVKPSVAPPDRLACHTVAAPTASLRNSAVSVITSLVHTYPCCVQATLRVIPRLNLRPSTAESA